MSARRSSWYLGKCRQRSSSVKMPSIASTGGTLPYQLRELEVFDFQLDVLVAVVGVEGGLEGDVDSAAGGELVEEVAGAEGDGFDGGVALADEELEMVAGFSDAAGGGGELGAFQ